MDKYELKERILNKIKEPIIPAKEYSASQFGITSDCEKIQTMQLQYAIDQISLEGGGKLILPKGTYRTGALQLKNSVELHLEDEGTILAFVREEPEKHYPLVYSHWEATPCYNYSAFLYANGAHDIAITGNGLLDGGADSKHWWNWHHQVEDAWSEDKPDLQLKDRMKLRRMNEEGVPVNERIFGSGHYLRPNFVQLLNCQRILLKDITLKNSPMWQLNPVMCESLIVDGVTLSSHGANNDGCDPESCTGVYIRNCFFDTGDDCISLKSGRDRDGRIADRPCEDVLIEGNQFADGHGGIALGSEMSGGIRRIVAMNNRFCSPNLTYALRLKTNARRGGKIEDVILADSVMDHVHGAAVHGTMLYEDGRNGNYLPGFSNITVENIVAHGGDYGIFLEAFDEVPITGLVLKNIQIDHVDHAMRGMNWKDPVLENIMINGKKFPRPDKVRILGVPEVGNKIRAFAECCGEKLKCTYSWSISSDRKNWAESGWEIDFLVPEGAGFVRLTVEDTYGNKENSHIYRVISKTQDEVKDRLICRGMLDEQENLQEEKNITRLQLSKMLKPLAKEDATAALGPEELVKKVIEKGFLAFGVENRLELEAPVTRQEMATVAMQACGVNYRNASSTTPVCRDADQVSNNYGTNAARALYFKFMELDDRGYFYPAKSVTVREAMEILNRVADFAGI